MVQTVKTITVMAGEKTILFEKPHTLHRIFFSVRVLASQTTWYPTGISFDDPLFLTYYSLNGPEKYFAAEGMDIFQGNVWIKNNSDTDLLYTATEILYQLC